MLAEAYGRLWTHEVRQPVLVLGFVGDEPVDAG